MALSIPHEEMERIRNEPPDPKQIKLLHLPDDDYYEMPYHELSRLNFNLITDFDRKHYDPNIDFKYSITILDAVGKNFHYHRRLARYIDRKAAIGQLGLDLGRFDKLKLLKYMGEIDEELRPDQAAALKNGMMRLLRSQEVFPEELVPRLASIFNAGIIEPTTLDYIIQHLGAAQSQTTNATHLAIIRDTLRKTSLEIDKPYSGTALLGLSHNLSNAQKTDDYEFFKERVLAIAANYSADSSARVSAIKLSGEYGFMEVLPAIRAIISSPAAQMPLKTAAINALGILGDKTDLAKLKYMLVANQNPRLIPYINTAIKSNQEGIRVNPQDESGRNQGQSSEGIRGNPQDES